VMVMMPPMVAMSPIISMRQSGSGP